jgi:predicted lipid-binding transport protein (Tim44 family)
MLKAMISRAALGLGVAAAFAQPVFADVTADLQKKVSELSTEQQAALLLLLDQLAAQGAAPAAPAEAAAAAPAEAAPAAPVDDNAAVKAVVEKFGTSAAKEDMEGMMSVFSDSFEHYQYGDKAGVKEFLQQSADMGYLEGIEFSMEDAEFEKDGETISVYPVDVEGSFGSITFEYVLKKEGDAWKIVEFDASGL